MVFLYFLTSTMSPKARLVRSSSGTKKKYLTKPTQFLSIFTIAKTFLYALFYFFSFFLFKHNTNVTRPYPLD